MSNILVAQSGGPTVAINASLAGVIEGALKSDYDTIYGSINGIVGITEDRVFNLSEVVAKDDTFISKLKTTPAMYLGSCRFKLPSLDSNDPIYDTIFAQFKKYDIGAFFYIGGNDSMDTVDKLSKYAAKIGSDVKVMGCPKTVDNDLMITDHTPGFGSAAKYVATCVMETCYDACIYAVNSVTIVEIMGRDAGWLTAASVLAKNDYCDGPDLIYLPEVAFDKEAFIADLKSLLSKKQNIIVAVSEGIKYANGEYVAAGESAHDNFGHAQLSGTGKTLEYMVKDELGVKVRSVELNVLQRAAAHMCSLTDITESACLGNKAVELACEGITGAMVTLTRTSDAPYTVEYGYAAISGIANEAKEVPRDFINAEGNFVTDKMVTYLRPLVMGEPALTYENGLPLYVRR